MSKLKFEEVTPFMQTTNQIINDLYSLFQEEESADLGRVEKIILSNLDKNFTRLRVAELAGISVRTVRNKLNESV